MKPLTASSDQVCHKEHDVTYAKYGSFFCDCGAKDDGSCQAITRRNPDSGALESGGHGAAARDYGHEVALPSSLRRRNSSSSADRGQHHAASQEKPDAGHSRHLVLAKQLEARKADIFGLLRQMNVSWTVLSLLQYLTPAIAQSCARNSSIGCSIRARKALQELHGNEMNFETNDQLMVPTLGSQEGAFENVRMSYSGEQGQTIRQLISTHVIRRVAMCALTSPHGSRQHLAVSHEKGKITLLQLAT